MSTPILSTIAPTPTVSGDLPVVGWDPDWRESLPFEGLRWSSDDDAGAAAVRWMRAGAPVERLRVFATANDAALPALHGDPETAPVSVRLAETRPGRFEHQERLEALVLHRAEVAARWTPAPAFLAWFDDGTQALAPADQQRLLVRCLLGAFDANHRPVFDGLWARWMARVDADGLHWNEFLHAQHDRRPQPDAQRTRRNSSATSGRSLRGWGYERSPYGRLTIEDPWGWPTRVEERFRSSHPWHLPFVERALTARGCEGGAMVQNWAADGTCPVSAWDGARMGPYRERPPVAALHSPLCGWVWERLAGNPAYVRHQGDDLMEDWLVGMIRAGAHGRVPGSRDAWIHRLTPWLEGGARLPHDREPNRGELDDRLPSVFEAPSARAWDPAVMNHQNNVPDLVRKVWAALTPLEQHLDEVRTLRDAADSVQPATTMPNRPRGRL